MNLTDKKPFRVAILDMNNGIPNQGMRCIREILKQYGKINDLNVETEEFEVRIKKQAPDLSFDAYISSGGPGSPLESEGNEWEQIYFNWLSQVEDWNNNTENFPKKYVFFICHSFQLVCRHWKLATVCKRKSTSFGVFPIYMLQDGKEESVFSGMNDPFYAVDSRDWQVIEPQMTVLHTGAKILCIEKDRPHLPYERAIMAMRFNEYFIGTQFHPEADPLGMSMHLQTPEKKANVVQLHGLAKWESMVEQLNDPDKISWTYSHILPNFLDIAVDNLEPVSA